MQNFVRNDEETSALVMKTAREDGNAVLRIKKKEIMKQCYACGNAEFSLLLTRPHMLCRPVFF